MKISIGIDPGLETGGMTILPEKYEDMLSIMTPRKPSRTVRGKTVEGEIDLDGIVRTIFDFVSKDIYNNELLDILIIYEDVHSLYKSAALGNFNFGQRKGELAGIAASVAFFLPMINSNVTVSTAMVYSTVWQKHSIQFQDRVFTEKGTTDTKATSKRCAMRIFPWYRFTKGRGVVVQDGMTDSALIALYGMEAILKKK